MGVIVTKFGGSSLADAHQFRKVHSIINSNPDRCYVVPSAPGKRNAEDYKITDLLYLCHAHVEQSVPYDDVYHIITQRYQRIIQELGLSLQLEPLLEEIKSKIIKGATADYTASRGEYLNGVILANYLGFDFIDAAEVIFFTKAGSFDAKRTQQVLSERLKKHSKAVIPGFYGSLPNGRIKTFSRGGSDISGAIIARGASASLYENWTDVSGFLMADPRIVQNPKPIAKITYRELRELSYMGAIVLHEESIFPVRESGIPISIKNTNAPSDPGTLIVTDADPITRKGTITGIAGKKDFTVIIIEKALMNTELGFGRKILGILENNEISFEHLPSGIDSLSVVISDSQLDGKLDIILEEIRQQCKPDSIEVTPDMSLIATVGRGMAYTPGVSAKLFSALGSGNINIRMIDQGSSEINIIIGIGNSDFEKAIQTIYNAFVV